MMPDIRADLALYQRGLCKSRERARKLIKNGNVQINGKVCLKPSECVSEDDVMTVTGDIHNYVGRGGMKLEKALEVFSVDLSGMVCLDIGASTGGFTDCMLQNGARLVYALDVGHSQLDEKLLSDSRVINMEKTNIRNSVRSDFKEDIEFIATDVSFISLKLVLPVIRDLLTDDGLAVVLIKPQFEAGKENIGKSGIVKEPRVHKHILNEMIMFSSGLGLSVSGLSVSPIKGGDGNIEYLMYLKKTSQPDIITFDTDSLVNEAFKKG